MTPPGNHPDIEQVLAEAVAGPPAAVLADLYRACLRRLDADLAPVRLLELASTGGSAIAGPIASTQLDGFSLPEVLGAAHQALLARSHRRRNGVFYTSSRLAERLVAVALDPDSEAPHPPPRSATGPGGETVCDPSVGAGAFLLAAARHLAARGVDPREVVEQRLFGVEIDPLAAAVTEASLVVWAVEQGSRPPGYSQIVVGDALRGGLDWWPGAPEGFHLVIGNPPFQNQLGAATARSRRDIDDLRSRFGPAVRAYADTATLFLLQALRWSRPGGRVAMLQPVSFLMARDADATRRLLLDDADLVGLWHCHELLFDAQVRVCAPILRRSAPTTDGDRPARDVGSLRRFAGPELTEVRARAWQDGEPDGLNTWSPLVADLLGVPQVELDPTITLRHLARATAGFRDQYYGLVGHVEEQAAETDSLARCRLVTTGLIEPGRVTWGMQPTRFANTTWLEPMVRLDALDGKLRAWADDLLVPKVVVATQTKVLEGAVDEAGEWYPSVPVIALVPHDPADLWRVAAVVLAPPVSAWAWTRHAGGALSADTVKLAARDVLELPVPTDREAWDLATEQVKRAAVATDAATWLDALEQLGVAMCQAYDQPGGELLDWWRARLPRWRGTRSPSTTAPA